jgi:hypothetical protein
MGCPLLKTLNSANLMGWLTWLPSLCRVQPEPPFLSWTQRGHCVWEVGTCFDGDMCPFFFLFLIFAGPIFLAAAFFATVNLKNERFPALRRLGVMKVNSLQIFERRGYHDYR